MSEEQTKTTVPSAQATPQAGQDRTTLIAFGTFVLLSGGASLAIRAVYGELAPFWSGALRFALVALIFWLLVLFRKVPLPRGRALTGAVLFGVLSVGAAFILVYYGLTKTPASLYQVIVAIVPLLTLFFAAVHRLEKITKRGVAGGLLAFAGITIAVSGSLFSGVSLSLPHIVAILLGAACFAEAGIVIKLFPPTHPYATNAVAITVGTLMLAAASLIAGEPWMLPSLPHTWLALAYLVAAAVIVFLLYLFILGRWTASRTAYGFVLIPFVTIFLAGIFFDETITTLFLIGATVVLTGVYLGALRPAKKTAEPPEEPPPEKEDIHQRPGLPTCV